MCLEVFLKKNHKIIGQPLATCFLCHHHQTQIFGGLAHFCQAKHVAQNHQLLASHWPQDVLTLTKHSQVCNLATLWPQDVLYTCVWKCFLRTIRLLASPWPHFCATTIKLIFWGLAHFCQAKLVVQKSNILGLTWATGFFHTY